MSSQNSVSLGIRVIELFDEASFSSTYKMATLLGLIEVIQESASADGNYPKAVSGTAVADKVFERYWRQSVPYAGSSGQPAEYLKQSSQRDIPQVISSYRAQTGNISRNATIESAQLSDPKGMARLRKDVRQRVLRMPIPRLQKHGNKNNWTEDRFLFDYGWEEDKVPKDDSLTLKDGVAVGLMETRPLLRPYIEMLWTAFVADRNTHLTDASHLRTALFGGLRTDTSALRKPLRQLQNGLCFYCGNSVLGNGDIDHFLPLAHFGNEDLDNFVLACSNCNNSKSASLPALVHLKKLLERNQSSKTLDQLAESLSWPRMTARVNSTASTGYHSKGVTKLWLSPGNYEDLDAIKATTLLTNYGVKTEN
jgi:5-methylcytosine-specific restriction endonuclease McrA